MKKRPILNAYEMKIFKEWIADGNAVETEKGVWLEQTTQYRKKFTYEELQNFFKKEYLTYKNGGSAKDLLSSRAGKVAKKEKSLNLKAYNVPSVTYAINPLNEGLDEMFQDVVGKDELREAMSGVDFVGNTATGTDAHKLLHLVGKREGKFKDGNYYLFSTMENEWSKDKILSKEMSVAEYYKQRSLIEQRFPNWIPVVYDSFDYKQEFNLTTLYDIVNSLVVSKLLNKQHNGIIIELNTKDGAYQVGFNAKIIRSIIKSLIMAGITDATGYFNTPSKGVTILDTSLKFPNKNKRDEFFMENSFGLIMPIMIPDEETLEERKREMAEFDNLVYEFPIIRVISPNEYEIEINGQDTLTYSRGKDIKIGRKSTQSTTKETPQSTTKTTDKKTALGNKLRKGMVVRIEYKESNGSTLSYDLFYDNGEFIEYVLITDKKGKEIVETEEIITEKELNDKYTELSEFIVAEFYENMADGGQLGKQMTLFNTGGKIGFDALAKKVAKRYAGQKVESKYQAEYGKKYSKSEAEEVGRKVAGKVYRQQQGIKFNGGGKAIRPSLYSVYKVKDKMGRVMYLNDNELQKFINDWNEDYFTDYEDWVEFNEYEMEFVITPVFSKNEMGGDVDFVETQINDIANWENEEIASYLEIPVNEVANNREEYIEEAQNYMLVNQVDGDYAMGGIIGNEVDFMYYGEPRKGKIIEDFGDSYGVQSGSSQIAVDKDDILRTIKPKKETSFSFFDDGGIIEVVGKGNKGAFRKREYEGMTEKEVADFWLERGYTLSKSRSESKLKPYTFYIQKYADGGGVGEFPPKGELTNKDNFLLKYEKKGSDYEFFVYKPITKEVSGYNQIKHVCLNKDCPQKMNYEQFINYLYAELYLDDNKYAGGGGVNEYDAESLRRKKSEMNISINTQTGQVYVGGIKPKNKLYEDDKGYYLIEGYGKFMNQKYPIKKYFSPIENVVLFNYMNNIYADGGEASELNIGQIFEVNRDSEKGKKYFDFHYGKGYVFIISDIFNEKVIDENQFWDAHIKLKVYDSNLKYIFPIRVFFKGKPYGLNLTKKLFFELLSDKSIFPSDNYYVEKESDYDRQEREFKGNGYVELIKRKINPIWKSIIDKFSEIYFSNGTDNDYLVSDQVKARGSNPYSSYEFRNFSPLLSWADAEGKFKQSLTADELNSIEISYNTEEYADLEEHDTEKYHKQIVVKLKTYADGGKVLASSSSKDGINKLIEQYLYGSTITLVETDNDKIYEVHNKKGKTSFYVEFSKGKYKFIQPSKFVGGGKAIRQTQFAVYKLLDKEGLVKYFTDTDLEKFLEEWNEDYNTDYEDFVEFNEYEREFIIKPVFSKNDMGGTASQPSFLEIQINDVPNWENEELANYLDAPISLVAKNRNFYVKEVQNEMMLNVIPNYASGGSAKKSMENSPLKEYYEKYTNGGFVGGDVIKFKYDGKDFTRKVESVDEMGNAVVNIMKTQKATINPADIFEIKKEKDDKSIIIEKIGLNEENANFLIGLSPTFAVWLADSIVELTTKSNLYGSRFETIKALNEKPYLVAQFRERITGILDWLTHPTTRKQNLRELTFAEAERKSEEWHDSLSISGGEINYVEPIENTVIIEYPENDNGIKYYWTIIPNANCSIEGNRMGHCGSSPNSTHLISLRSVQPFLEDKTINYSHVTLSMNQAYGIFWQLKAQKNAKPAERYFPYIFDVLKRMAKGEITEQYKVTQQEKINELEGQKIEYEKVVNKLQKYFESREAIEEDTNVLVEKAGVFQTEKKKLEKINSLIKKLNEEITFEFNGIDCEYKCHHDYGWEDMTKEQIKELYEIKPNMFNDFAGQYMLYEAGLIDEKPNTSFLLEKDVDYVVDLLRVDRNTRDGIVKEVLSGETYDLIDAGYYYENAGDYVEQLKGFGYDSVLDKIVEITGYDKEEVKENGAEYYLNGEDENFDSDSFDDIKRAISNALAVALEDNYATYIRKQIESALEELGTIEKLDDTGLVLSVDLSNLLNMSQISAISKELDSNSVEDIFFEAERVGEIELPSLSIDDRYEPYPDDWQEYFDINNYAEGGAVYPDLSMQKAQVVNDSFRIPEFELKQAKDVLEINGLTNKKITSSNDSVDIFRSMWGKDTINAYEQAYVIFLNKGMKPIGYYHHSSGGIDGTIMDIQMISGMAVKSLAKGVIIAHNHPSGNTKPSDADERITTQMKQALKLFNIQLLDSIILTENSSLSFADEGYL